MRPRDVELAWEARAEAEQAMEAAEVAAGTAAERLLGERLSVTDVVELTGLGQPTLRRLRQTVAPREQPRDGETGHHRPIN